jgi:hypothetical protein
MQQWISAAVKEAARRLVSIRNASLLLFHQMQHARKHAFGPFDPPVAQFAHPLNQGATIVLALGEHGGDQGNRGSGGVVEGEIPTRFSPLNIRRAQGEFPAQ